MRGRFRPRRSPLTRPILAMLGSAPLSHEGRGSRLAVRSGQRVITSAR
ncbi:hypothetical protein A33M_4239 [Rhodovulum sp. PH10]|nr:hypothetical protein A33M_4239 [Rhodovulum sp. PH10]